MALLQLIQQLKDDSDINKQIQKAPRAFSLMEKALTDRKLKTKMQYIIYDATVVNILLWGCKSRAPIIEHLQKFEVCHHRLLQKMIQITIYDVKEKNIKKSTI